MSTGPKSARDRAIERHRERWAAPEFIVRAPGRVNLIGEHTDYNDGFVFPMAIPFDTVVAVSAAPEGEATTIESEGYGTVALDGGEVAPWAAHIVGVDAFMAEAGFRAAPWRGTIATDIPMGASLSSSAALEVAVGLVIAEQAGRSIDRLELARLCRRVENEVLGLPSGIMDQLISATAREGHASLIDCRSFETRPQPLPVGATVVVMDTNTRRELVDSEFASRRASCERAAALLGVGSLRDADDLGVLQAEHELEWRRARHVIAENERTLAAAEAMARGDAEALGALMTESHLSLRDDYEVSGPALDAMVEVAWSTPGCLGARMTGGGFAGCAVALVIDSALDAFVEDVARGYEARTGTTARIWPCTAAPGASVEREHQ